MQMLERLAVREEGGVAVIFGIGAAAILMLAGLAMTTSDMNWTTSKTLAALDSSVLAGASAPSGTSDAMRIAIAEQFYRSNQSISKDQHADIGVSRDSAAFGTTETTVYGIARVTRPSIFGSLFSQATYTVQLNSAATKAAGHPICLLGLDPTEEATIDFNGRAEVQLEQCASMANSASGAGMRQVGQPSMKAADIGVTGGYTGAAYEPEPTTGVTPHRDPLASLPAPVTGACHAMSGARLTQEVLELGPGTYCGGLNIQAGSKITLQPGVHIFKDGPLTIQAGASVTGSEVMLAFLGETSTYYMYGDAQATFTSPTSGTYKNIQFFGDRAVYGRKQENLWFTVIGQSVLKYDGVLYVPSFHVWLAGGSDVQATSPSYAAIAKKFWFQDHTRVRISYENPRGLDVEGAVRLGSSAKLIR